MWSFKISFGAILLPILLLKAVSALLYSPFRSRSRCPMPLSQWLSLCMAVTMTMFFFLYPYFEHHTYYPSISFPKNYIFIIYLTVILNSNSIFSILYNYFLIFFNFSISGAHKAEVPDLHPKAIVHQSEFPLLLRLSLFFHPPSK